MVELRKRPASVEVPARPAKRGPAGKKGKEKKGVDEEKAPAAVAPADTTVENGGEAEEKKEDKNGAHEAKAKNGEGAQAEAKATEDAGDDVVTKLGQDSIGKKIELSGFGGTVTTHENKSVGVKDLVEESSKGIVIFTYPRASTPGCTTQACLFRDSYAPITEAGLSVYGLSTDSEKSNTTFATKQKLPYPLLCDPKATLTGAIGMAKGGKSTTRGVVVIDKQGTVRVWQQAGPQKTLDVVLEYIKTAGMADTDVPDVVVEPSADHDGDGAKAPETATRLLADPDVKMDEVPLARTPTNEEREAAETAAEVGEVAAKLDREEDGETA